MVEPDAGESGPVVIGEICHIHARKPGGPRWKEERNSPANLIMLCPNHHAVVDGQPEFYTAEMLRQWKREHESKIKNRHPASLDVITELVDQKIKEETDIIRKSRFFEEFDRTRFSLTLARKLVEGELSVGSDAVRSESLAWCVRLLCTEKLDKAEKYLTLALDSIPHVKELIFAAASKEKRGC